jgi:Ca2+-binding EF-hand superfamily protein
MPHPKAKAYSKDEMDALKAAFASVDTDKSNYLDQAELAKVFQGEPDPEGLAQIVVYLYGANQKVWLKQFISFLEDAAESAVSDPQLIPRKVFAKIDKDKSGYLDAKELVQLAKAMKEPLTLEEAQAGVAAFASDANKGLTFEEALKAFPVLA